MRLAFVCCALFLAGCGTTKVVVKERTQTQTVTHTVKQATTSTAAPEPTIYVDTPAGLLYKPDSMSYYGGEQFIAHIRWITYGNAVAVGKAEFARNDCNPGCGEGHYTYKPITIRLMDRLFCHGVTAYTSWSLHGAGLDATSASIVGPDSVPCQ